MHVVIDIPEWKYKSICEGVEASLKIDYSIPAVFEAVANGIVLPKGHGRLIDVNTLSDYFWDNRSKLYTRKDLQVVLDNTETIIEADTSESEEE